MEEKKTLQAPKYSLETSPSPLSFHQPSIEPQKAFVPPTQQVKSKTIPSLPPPSPEFPIEQNKAPNAQQIPFKAFPSPSPQYQLPPEPNNILAAPKCTTGPVLPLLFSPPLYISGQPTSCICAKKQDLPICKKENMMEKLDRTMCRLVEETVKIQQAKLNLRGKILQWIIKNPNINHPIRCMIILNKRRSCKKRLFWE